MLDRYQFETLTFIEKNGKKDCSIRKIADDIRISGTAVMKALDDMSQLNYIHRDGELIEILPDGIAALEPYRVKKAVIMAAGFGSRMMPATQDRPKPLVTVNGKRIIDTLLDALVEIGIHDITIVRGYKKERFDEILEKYPFIKLVDNDIYDQTNNISFRHESA